jgi:hypothetical protein
MTDMEYITMRLKENPKSRSSQRALLVVMTAVAFCCAMAASAAVGPSHAQGGVPANLAPPAGQVMQQELLGIGAQVYTCRASEMAASGYEWAFTAPSAVLLDESGAIAGTHFGGPAWQANDGSKVVAEVVERAPSPDPSAIPWLLLRVTSSGAPGNFSDVTYIQRLDTTGGLAPTGGCDAEHIGAVARVPYTAVYVLFSAADR